MTRSMGLGLGGRSVRRGVAVACRRCVVISRDENGSDTDGYHRYYICFHISVRIRIRIRIMSTMSDMIRLDIDICDLSIRIRIRYRMLDIWTRIRTDLNPSKRIRFRIRSENIRTVFIPTQQSARRLEPSTRLDSTDSEYRAGRDGAVRPCPCGAEGERGWDFRPPPATTSPTVF